VAIDTSGSIADDDLSGFFAEVHGLWRQGAEVTVIECDAAVQRAWTYRGKLPTGVAGRGGTSFDPVFEWLRRQRAFDGCIYLTDAVAPAPVVRPPCRLLWVVTPGGRPGPHLRFGRTIVLSPAGA
jgi:predicted metal-dependent peptidase